MLARLKGWRKEWRCLIIALLAAGNFLIWFAVWQEDRRGILTVAFLDVGQGDAIFIEAPNGNQLLIDGGPNGQVLRALGEVMPFYDRTLDLVLATHPDADHIAGLPEVFERYEVAGVIDSGFPAATGVFAALTAAGEKEAAPRLEARRGQRFFLDDEVWLDILFPDRPIREGDANAASVVARLQYGEQVFLLTGDAPRAIENYLLATTREALDATVLKLGHHGSDTSTGEAWLAATSPEYAVISVGEGNRYGHPAPAVLERLALTEAQILRTDQEGTIVFQTDGLNLKLSR